jgi:hypothetical protein
MESTESDQPRKIAPNTDLKKRLTKEKRWGEAQKEWKRLTKEAKYKGMDPEASEAWANTELERLYPNIGGPSQPLQIARETIVEEPKEETRSTAQIPIQPIENNDQSSITGLDKIPPSWRPLPGNASLQAEISWVQANRLMVVKETGNGTVVSLRKAMGPPPSWAALGWLETSIRTYAKFVEVAAKATASIASEEEEIKRERVAIEEVRRLLNEMLLPGDV